MTTELPSYHHLSLLVSVMISKLELHLQQTVKHFGYKAGIALKLLFQPPRIQFEIALRQFFKWPQFCSITPVFR
jgi:hypothetical protein